MAKAETGTQSPVEPASSPTETSCPATNATLRGWPAVLIVAFMWLVKTVPAWLFPESPLAFNPLFFGVVASIGLFFVWWLAFSRTPWRDRLVGFAVLLGGLVAGGAAVYHPSVLGMPLLLFVMPLIVTAIVAAMVFTKPLGWQRGRSVTFVVTLAAVLAPAFVRFGSVNSEFVPVVRGRWQASEEERLLASLGDAATSSPTAALSAVRSVDGSEETLLADEPAAPSIQLVSAWPGFRGPLRDGHIEAGQLTADWPQPLNKLWRRDVGPGWGSFCLVGDTLITQEQRGEQECVVAYESATGEQSWSTGVSARFSESVAGPGPRATPTYHAGALYTTGAAGDVLRLDALTGAIAWRRNLIEDTPQDQPPMWGFASSPLLVDLADGRTLVLVYAGNPMGDGKPQDQAVIAYDAANGDPVWKSGVGDHGYSSPHLATLGGVEQTLVWTNKGLESLAPATGEQLWFYDWDLGQYPRSTQPLVVDDQTLVLSAGYDSGTMPIRVTNQNGEWQVEELWEAPSRDLVPYFNDMVLHEGHLYGLHKKFLVSINLETGEPTWPRKVKRKTKLGNGQVVLDPQAGRLLVTTEDTGEVLLVDANPEAFVVLGRFEALTPGTNWNHPVVADGRLYVRHGSEAACYELPNATRPAL